MSAGGKRPGAGRKRGSLNKVTAEVRELAMQHAPAAMAELARLVKSAKSENTRVAAIREILDRAYGKPKQAVVGDYDHQIVTFTIEGLPDSRSD